MLKSAGYLAQDVGNALKLAFGDTDGAVAEAMKAAGYLSAEVAGVRSSSSTTSTPWKATGG